MRTGEDDATVPLVSVVLPTYDRPEFLRSSVASVEQQTYPRVELVVVDDHSPNPADATLDRGSTDLHSMRVIRHGTNRGANVARRTGIDHAHGTLIAFLDDDDRWHPAKLAKQVAAFEADEEVGVVYTGQQYRDRHGNVTGTRVPSTRGDATRAILRGASVGPFSTLLVSARVIDAAGGPDPRFPSLQDKEWLVRLSRHGRLEVIEEPLVIRRIHAGDRISENFTEKRDVTYPLFLKKHRELAASYGSGTERRFIANLTASVAASALAAGRYRDAVRFSLRTIRYHPGSSDGYLYLLAAIGGDYTATSARIVKRLLSTRRHV